MENLKVAVIGATGYTGSELARILVHHPKVNIAAITSESRKGEKFSDVHPFFSGILDTELVSVKDLDIEGFDLAFLALPHGVSMEYVKMFSDSTTPLIDFSGDFRLGDRETYESWYKKDHVFSEGFKSAAYGIPELYPEQIKSSGLIANPGCYPTSAILGLAPAAKKGLIDGSVIIDSKSGVTGAGIKAKEVNQFSNVNDNFKAYGIKTHRHSIEIEQNLNSLSGENLSIQFTPHLLPVDRGILTTAYFKTKSQVSQPEMEVLYADFYSKMPFIRLRNNPPAIKDVRGTNYCDVFVTYDDRTKNVIVISVIDNLVKGAAGQAVQNMNVKMGWDEKLGLNQVPQNP